MRLGSKSVDSSGDWSSRVSNQHLTGVRSLRLRRIDLPSNFIALASTLRMARDATLGS